MEFRIESIVSSTNCVYVEGNVCLLMYNGRTQLSDFFLWAGKALKDWGVACE